MEFQTVNLLIYIVITFLVTQGLKSLSKLLGKDFGGFGSAIVASVVALAVGLFNSVIVPLIPAEALPVIEPAAALIVSILGAFGVHYTYAALK